MNGRAQPSQSVAPHLVLTVTSRTADLHPVQDGPRSWWTEADTRARRAFAAAFLGWMLDSFDVMLFGIALAELIRD